MKLELLDKKSTRSDMPHYYGVTEQTIYACPCGQGTIVYEEDDIPGHRDWFTQIKCEECSKKYEIKNYSSPQWEIVEKK